MNNKVNYTVIGVLVLIGVSLMLGFGYWMLKPSSDSQMKKYTIFFDESVFGLNIDAPVKFRGIKVGKVSELKINPKNSEQVEVTISVLKTTPIKEHTVAKLTAQGITGLTYINLSMGKHESKLLQAHGDEPYPVIKSIPSFFENFEKSLGSVSSKLSSTLGRTEKLLGADNQEQVAQLLKSSATVMHKLEVLLDDKTIDHIHSSAKHMDSLSKKIDAVIPDVDRFISQSIEWEDKISSSFESIMKSYIGITASMTEIKRAIASGEFNLKEISSDITPVMNNTFLELEASMVKFQEVLEEYNNSPSDILYKREAIKKAPGER